MVVKEDVKFRPGAYREWLEGYCNRNGFESPQDAIKDLMRREMIAEQSATQRPGEAREA